MKRIPTHPGNILLEEFLRPRGITQQRLAKLMRTSQQRISGIVSGRRSVTPRAAWELSAALGTTPQFWMNLQVAYDLALAKPKKR